LFREPYGRRNAWEQQADPRALKMRAWLRSSGANLMVSGAPGSEELEVREAESLAPRISVNGERVPVAFDQADADFLMARVGLMREPGRNSPNQRWIARESARFDSELNARQDSFCFRTREGTVGLLQILNAENNPPGVRVRYKLLQPRLQPSVAAAGEEVPPPPGYQRGQPVSLPPGYERGREVPLPPAYTP